MLVMKAALFAAERHSSDVRKGSVPKPYINHCLDVGYRVSKFFSNQHMIAAAILHDVVEMERATEQEIIDMFGVIVHGLVMENTDDPSLTTIEQKRLQVEKMSSKSFGARVIKIADCTSNTNSIIEDPPVSWRPASIPKYLLSRKAVVDAGRGTHEGLEKEFDEVYAEAIKLYPPLEV